MSAKSTGEIIEGLRDAALRVIDAESGNAARAAVVQHIAECERRIDRAYARFCELRTQARANRQPGIPMIEREAFAQAARELLNGSAES